MLIEKMCEVLNDTLDEVLINGLEKMDDEKRFCSKCNWNDCDFGCTCPPNEEVYQCEMYMYYHPEEVAEFNKSMKEWSEKKNENTY